MKLRAPDRMFDIFQAFQCKRHLYTRGPGELSMFVGKLFVVSGPYKTRLYGEKGTKLGDFMRWEKKGSKCFRTILTKNSGTYDGKTIKNMPQVKTFLRLTETENVEINRIKNMMGMGSWNYSTERISTSCCVI